MMMVYAIVDVPDSWGASITQALEPHGQSYSDRPDAANPTKQLKLHPAAADAQIRQRYIDLSELATALGDASLETMWRAGVPVPVQDGTDLNVSTLKNSIGRTFPEVPDHNVVSTGSFTVGSGGSYSTWSAALADIGSPLTGNLTFTQISDTSESAQAAVGGLDPDGFTLLLDCDTPHLGDPTSGHEISLDFAGGANPAMRITFINANTAAGSTVEIKNLRFFSAVDVVGGGADMLEINSITVSGTKITRVHDCMFDANGGFRDGLRLMQDNEMEVWNLVIWDSDNVAFQCFQNVTPGTAKIENCVFKDAAGFGYSGPNHAGITERNNVAVGTGAFDFFSGASVIRENLASSDTTAGGTSPLTNIVEATEFVSTSDASADFMKVAAGQALDTSGATQEAFNTKGIRGNDRPGLDAFTSRGADELADPPTSFGEGTGTGHAESASVGDHVGDGEGAGTGHSEATATSVIHISDGEGSGTGHGEATATSEIHTGDGEGGGTGHIEATATIEIHVGDGEGGGVGHIEAVSVKGVSVDGEGGGVGHGEASSTILIPAFSLGEGTGVGHTHALAIGNHTGNGEGSGAGHVEAVSNTVKTTNGPSEGTATGHIEAVSNTVKTTDGPSEGGGVGHTEAASVGAHIGAGEGGGAGRVEATATSAHVGDPEGTGTGHAEAGTDIDSDRDAEGTSTGHGEATSSKQAQADGRGTARGHAELITWSTHPHGSIAIGRDQPPNAANSNYPFVLPSADIKRILGDFYLSYEDPNCELDLPLHVAWMAKFGEEVVPNFPGRPDPTHTYDLIVEDSSGVVVFDSTTAEDFVIIPFSDRLEAIEWKTPEAICRVVRHIKAKVGEPPLVFDKFIEPVDGELDAITYRQVPRRVRSFKVGPVTVAAEQVIFDEGFNISFELDEQVRVDGGRFQRGVLMRALPGDGLGRQPGCEDAFPAVRRINGIGPDLSGNLTLDALGCYRIQRPTVLSQVSPRQVTFGHPELTAEEAAAAIQIFNDCGPCCECDDFVNTYEGIRRLFDRYLELGDRAEAVRDQYAENKLRWDASARCRKNNPIRVVLQQEYGCRIAIGAAFCNLNECCIAPVELRMTLQVFRDGEIDAAVTGATFVCEETKRSGSDTRGQEVGFAYNGAFPAFTATYDHADPQSTSKFRTRATIPSCGPGSALRVTVTAHHGDAFKGDTTEPCRIVDPIDVPADIEALWAADPPADPARAIIQKTIALNDASPCRDIDGSP
jgi:hypothetical protein